MNTQYSRCFFLLAMLVPSLAAAQTEWIAIPSLADADASESDVRSVRFISAEAEPIERSTLMVWNSAAEASGGPPGWDEPLASDRPDFTEASCTVGRGVCQLEMGFTYFQDDLGSDHLQAYTYPEMLLRMGVYADWLELRLAWTYGNELIATGGIRNRTAGVEDLYLGLKLGLTPQQGILPEMSLMPQMTVPLGSDFSVNRVLPGVNWLYGWDINETFSTAGSTQLNLSVDGGINAEYVEFAQSWTIGYTLTEKLGAYTEWFVLVPAGVDTAQTEHYLDGGFTYRVTNNLQLDIRAGKGISGASVDFFAGSGLVARF